MLQISTQISIPDNEIEISAIRAQGADGQNVNKVSTAVHLRFDINASSLPEFYKEKLLALSDSRLSKDGIIVIKAQQFLTQEMNKEDAYNLLRDLMLSAAIVQKKRKATKPTKEEKLICTNVCNQVRHPNESISISTYSGVAACLIAGSLNNYRLVNPRWNCLF